MRARPTIITAAVVLALSSIAALASGVYADDDVDVPAGIDRCGLVDARDDRTDCIESAARRVVATRDLDTAIDVVDAAAERSSVVAVDCHMAMHPIGIDAGRRQARADDPFPLLRPTSFCHEGYVHGMQVGWLEGVTTDRLVRDGARMCDASDVNADWACGHSLGHALATRADSRGMPTAMRWCASAYDGAVHLGLDRDSFMTTCAKGALMEFVLVDERAGVTDMKRHACQGVPRALAPWCDGNVWLRASIGTDGAPSIERMLVTCSDLTTTRIGRRACAEMVGRSAQDADDCAAAPRDIAGACRRARALGPIDPASIPSG